MFTNVAHRPPSHHFSDLEHSFSHGDLGAPLGQHPSDASPFRDYSSTRNGDFRQRLQRPEQYAYPVQSSSSSCSSSSSSTQASNRNLFKANSTASEHMLRRKTPNGTLAAGYDGRPIEWTSRPHAMKHYLMPMSNTMGETLYQSIPAGTLEEYSPARNDLPYSMRAEEQRNQVRRDSIARSQSAYENGEDVGKTMHSSHRRRPDSFASTGLDSVLHQGSLSHHYNYFAGGQQVPTVLQPMWPPCLGLTSLNDAGPYGPYWPDGAFVPYRPAPLRDPRYQGQPQDYQENGAAQSQPARNSCRKWSQGGSDVDQMDLGEQLSDFAPHYQSFNNHSLPEEGAPRGRESFPHSRVAHDSHQHEANLLAHRAKLLPQRLQSMQAENTWDPTQQYSQFGPPPHQQVDFPEPNPRVKNAHFNDKVLVWAHQIYLSLLASLHHARRATSQTSRNGERHAQPNIYPKAPRQLSLPPSALQARTALGLNNSQRLVGVSHSSNDVSRRQFSHPQHISGTPGSSSENFIRPFEPSSFQNGQSRQPWQPNGQCPSPTHATMGRDHRDQPRSMMSSMIRDHESSPSTAAATALELLNRLCQESGWEWTDGLLLGGCLAYGLGDYQKALKWYSKVLHCDPK